MIRKGTPITEPIYMRVQKLDKHQAELARGHVIRQTVHLVSMRERAAAFYNSAHCAVCSAVGKKYAAP